MKLEVKNLVKKFKSTIAVDNISFIIEKNKTLGLLGPNGCGKTTSIGMMLGLITPSSGEIFIDDIKLDGKSRIKLLLLHRILNYQKNLRLDKILKFMQDYMV